ncbi:MAG: hypothetical protein ABSD63_16190 [Candidatus Korobacteraceae bacterium]|jgi:hypothetical protein
MIRGFSFLLLALFLAAALVAAAQQQEPSNNPPANAAPDDAVANPARPTVSTPATLTPVGYFQFETGVLAAWNSPDVSSQQNLNEVIKFSVSRWIELLVAAEPYAHSHASDGPTNGSGDVDLGIQGIIHHGEGVNPTVAMSYFGRVYSGDAPDLDIGSFRNSAILLVSADVKGFHYDTNYLFNEVVDGAVRRAQFGQTLSVSHSLYKKLGISGEIWHFTQPFLRSNTVGTLWALNCNMRKNLVLDGGFNRGLTSTSTRWEVFAGFTYLLPHKVRLH